MVLLKGARVVDPQVGLDAVKDVLIDGTTVAALDDVIEASDGVEVIDCAGKVLMPGFVDMHVHFRDPGFEYKEDIQTGVTAATHGGYTDVATMPNTNPITDTGTSVRYQIDRGIEFGLARVHPIGALTHGEEGESLAEIGDMTMEGACGFSDDGHGVQSAGMMRTCMEYVSQFGRPVIAHCEDESLTANGVINEGRASTRLGMFGWPALGEEIEVIRDIELCRLTGCPLHVAHISTARSLDLVRQAKADGLPVTCEVTPHHLFLTEENITDSYNTNLKVNPPLRTRNDVEALIDGLIDGSIDCVVSDHAPHAAHEKDCEFEIAYFGTIGLETTVPLLVSNLVNLGLLPWSRLVEACAVKPREILRLDPVKVEVGGEATFTIVDPCAEVAVTQDYFDSKSKNSAFLGMRLTGAASDVFVDGKQTLVNGVVAE